MIVLEEQDLDWLTRVEKRLMEMRKREVHHRPKDSSSCSLEKDIVDVIEPLHHLRQMLQLRFGHEMDGEIGPGDELTWDERRRRMFEKAKNNNEKHSINEWE